MLHVYVACTERANTAAVPCGTRYASAVRTHFGGWSETRYKKLVTQLESQASAVSLLESGETALYKSNQQHCRFPS